MAQVVESRPARSREDAPWFAPRIDERAVGRVASVGISPFVRGLREKVGPGLLLLPSTTVLPRDDDGRLLLVRLRDSGHWATIGGAVEPDESPKECAVREAREEAGVEIALGPVLGVFGGPEYRVTYPNGDETAYVVTVFDRDRGLRRTAS